MEPRYLDNRIRCFFESSSEQGLTAETSIRSER